MRIKHLIKKIDGVLVQGFLKDVFVKGITCDSRYVRPGVLFVAVAGPQQEGHRYIQKALQKRAAAIILDNRLFLPSPSSKIPVILVRDSRAALKVLADVFFGYPYSEVRTVGITGTNGKTTITYLIRSILRANRTKSGVIGTIGYQVKGVNKPLSNTTPGVLELHRLFREMRDAGNRYVVMEVSSHALDQDRVEGIIFKAAVFTNLTQDHLDYHNNMEAYFLAKQKLFTRHADKSTALIINQDDPFGRRLLKILKGQKWSYGFSSGADIHAERYDLSEKGSQITIKTGRGRLFLSAKLVGKHNVSNILAAVAFGVSQGVKLSVIKKGIEAVRAVPGRLDRIDSRKGFSVFVDYAHTDDALKNVLESLAAIVHNGRIITVFGCGGDRDKGKRPKMGRVATSLSDYCFVTSDNPRSEKPQRIVRDIVRGIIRKNFEVELDRSKAIQKAVNMARSGDVVLVAGKGHETYQVIGSKILPFNDKAVVSRLVA